MGTITVVHVLDLRAGVVGALLYQPRDVGFVKSKEIYVC